jgi:dienelactone hydrolase
MKVNWFAVFMGILLLSSSLAAPSSVLAWSTSPQKVTFVNGQGLTLEGWLFKPAGSGPYKAVVLMHGCSGVYSYSDTTKGVATLYREWGDRLVSSNYVALLVDSFTTRNAAQNQCGNGSGGVSEVDDRPYDAYAGLDYLASQSFVDAASIGLLGWSHGGSATLATMDVTQFDALSNFKAAAAFYPGCGLYGAFGGVNNSTWEPYAPFIVLHGSADTVVSPAYCQTRVDTAQSLGATDTSITIFQNAQHSFDMARSVSNGFTQDDVNAKTAADAQVIQFFATHLP